eukprot:g22071.t1
MFHVPHDETGTTGAHVVFTYHPTSIHIQKIITCHFRHLQQDATTRHVFPSTPLSTFCRDCSLWDTLVYSSFTLNTSPQPHGTFPCNWQRCNTCPFTSSLSGIQGPKHAFQ